MSYYKEHLNRVDEFMEEKKDLSKPKKISDNWIGFFIFGFLLLYNIVVMTLFLIDSGYEYKILKNNYIDAVLPDQSIDQTLLLDIVKIKEPVFSELEIGDKIIISGDFDLDVYWVETILEIDTDNSTIVATYDNLSSSIFTEEEIIGVYIEDANFIGTLYYSASYTRGFIFLTISHVILLYGYSHLFLAKKEQTK